MAGAKEVEKRKEPNLVGGNGNTDWRPECLAKEFGLYLVWDGKPLTFFFFFFLIFGCVGSSLPRAGLL